MLTVLKTLNKVKNFTSLWPSPSQLPEILCVGSRPRNSPIEKVLYWHSQAFPYTTLIESTPACPEICISCSKIKIYHGVKYKTGFGLLNRCEWKLEPPLKRRLYDFRMQYRALVQRRIFCLQNHNKEKKFLTRCHSNEARYLPTVKLQDTWNTNLTLNYNELRMINRNKDKRSEFAIHLYVFTKFNSVELFTALIEGLLPLILISFEDKFIYEPDWTVTYIWSPLTEFNVTQYKALLLYALPFVSLICFVRFEVSTAVRRVCQYYGATNISEKP
jgi:hypothetical protein